MSLETITTLPALPVRRDEAHKGDFGRALIVGGSLGMSGAVVLAGLGALRGGAGLVYLAVPEGILASVAAGEPSYLTIPLPEDANGRLDKQARKALDDAAAGKNAVALGPGWGTSAGLTKLAGRMYRNLAAATVIDADGLNALAGQPDVLSVHAAPRILTPHPGEFARLTGESISSLQADREARAARFAAEHDVVLLLKGHRTVITDGSRMAINTTGNAGMATGGCGDVLTGLLTALLAQGMAPFEATQLAAHLHGLAGDLAAAELSQPALIASDLPRFLPASWLQLQRDLERA